MPALGNLRAPRRTDFVPSTALYKPASETVVVQSETLTFNCAKTSCAVTAVYDVKSDAEQVLQFEFILPSKESITAKVGKADAPVVAADAEPLAENELKSDLSRRESLPLYRAKFEVKLPAGASKITVNYDQPIGAEERGHGYSSDGHMVKELQYEVWPLNEWKRAPGFTITAWVSMKSKKPGLFRGWFGRQPSIKCEGVTGKNIHTPEGDDLTRAKEQAVPMKAEWNGDVLEGGFAWKDGFPDRLVCELDDE